MTQKIPGNFPVVVTGNDREDLAVRRLFFQFRPSSVFLARKTTFYAFIFPAGLRQFDFRDQRSAIN